MEDEGLFREEALRRWREGGTQGQVLRLAPGWTRWAVALLLTAVAVMAVWAWNVELETKTGRVPLREILLPGKR